MLALGSERKIIYNGAEMEVNTFIERLEQDFPDLRWRAGRKFAFRPPRTIIYEQFFSSRQVDDNSKPVDKKMKLGAVQQSEQICEAEDWRRYQLCLLHELGHATLQHREFRTDPERLRMEMEAWRQAERLCGRYGIEFDMEFAEQQLDSYRDWLHRRSLCPRCGLTCYQTPDGRYHCPGCAMIGRD